MCIYIDICIPVIIIGTHLVPRHHIPAIGNTKRQHYSPAPLPTLSSRERPSTYKKANSQREREHEREAR